MSRSMLAHKRIGEFDWGWSEVEFSTAIESVVRTKSGTGEDHDVMTADEVAAFLRCDPKTVYLAARAGRLPCLRLGRSYRFSRAAILEWARRYREEGR